MKKIAVLPGDGVGQEVTAEAIKVFDTISEKYGHAFDYEYALVGGAAVDAYGTALPQETLDLCRTSDAILFGAAGGPKWDNLPSHQRVERALATIRKELDLYVNLRPMKVRPALAPVLPIKKEIVGDGLDFIVLRELTGGLYYGEPRGIFFEADGKRKGLNTLVYTDYEIERIARAAFELARTRSKRVTSVAKENMMESSRLWRDVVTEVSRDYPDVELNHVLIDAATYHLIRNPRQFDVIVTGNIFGDILTDEAAALVGSLGLCPSASYGDSARRFAKQTAGQSEQGLYEPIHGTAPDIAGQGIANPIGAILSAALLLRHSFEMKKEAEEIERAVENVLEKGYRTTDIAQAGKKTVGTKEMGELIADELHTF
ncbi:3-isopropylmalate dehydrogenase [Candidatus Poribacteria bacterium]|nr:3-isopropylmalate dehydrogenase [Candidatus Poribacteria bacterium]